VLFCFNSVFETTVPLRGVQLAVTSPSSAMIVVGQSVQFNLSAVDGPSNVQYQMDYGDGSLKTAYNDSTMYSHSYVMSGEFTVTAIANDTSQTVSRQYCQYVTENTSTVK
jgi:hypothetical protein